LHLPRQICQRWLQIRITITYLNPKETIMAKGQQRKNKEAKKPKKKPVPVAV
jgi:hypothetical protein